MQLTDSDGSPECPDLSRSVSNDSPQKPAIENPPSFVYNLDKQVEAPKGMELFVHEIFIILAL